MKTWSGCVLAVGVLLASSVRADLIPLESITFDEQVASPSEDDLSEDTHIDEEKPSADGEEENGSALACPPPILLSSSWPYWDAEEGRFQIPTTAGRRDSNDTPLRIATEPQRPHLPRNPQRPVPAPAWERSATTLGPMPSSQMLPERRVSPATGRGVSASVPQPRQRDADVLSGISRPGPGRAALAASPSVALQYHADARLVDGSSSFAGGQIGAADAGLQGGAIAQSSEVDVGLFRIQFDGDFTSHEIGSIYTAFERWSNWIANSPSGDDNLVRIEMKRDADPSDLGYAWIRWHGPTQGYAWTPAQSRILHGDTRQATADVTIGINPNYSDNRGTALLTTMLHEIGHAMGISCSYLGGKWGNRPGAVGYLTRWDAHLFDDWSDLGYPVGTGVWPHPDYDSFRVAGDGNVFFHRPIGEDQSEGERVFGGWIPVYSPGKFESGSSLVHPHVDPLLYDQYITYPVMFYAGMIDAWAARDGATQVGLYDYEVAIFEDLGWTFVTPNTLSATGRPVYDPNVSYPGNLSRTNDWHNGSAWCFGLPPRPTTHVTMGDSPFGGFYTIRVSKDVEAASLTIEAVPVETGYVSRGRLRIDGGQLTLHSHLHTDGDITIHSGTLTTPVTSAGRASGRKAGTFWHHDGTHTADRLELGSEAGSKATYALYDGEVVSDFQAIGFHGGGTFNHLGGRNTTGALIIGQGANSTGLYVLDGDNAELAAGRLEVGRWGDGTFIHKRGTSTNTELSLASQYNSKGQYELYDGEVFTGGLLVGWNSDGTFRQFGGTHVVDWGDIGYWSGGSTGTYELGGGELIIRKFFLGGIGTGTFIQTGGSNTVSSQVTIGCVKSSGGAGAYEMSDGELSVPTIILDETGEFNQIGGTLKVTEKLDIRKGSCRLGGAAVVYNASVWGGTLHVDGSLIVENELITHPGATLSGFGTIDAPLVSMQGTLAREGDPGTRTFSGDLALEDGAVWQWGFVNSTDGQFDMLVADTLVLPLEGAVTLEILGLDDHSVSLGDTFTIFSGNVVNFDFDRFELVNYSSWTHGWEVSEGSLTLAAVPEPGTVTLLSSGLLVWLVLKYRRRIRRSTEESA